MKGVRNQVGVVIQCGHFSDRGSGGSSDADSALFGAKNSDISKFMMCPHRKGGGDQIFAILCGHLLWTCCYKIRLQFSEIVNALYKRNTQLISNKK